MSALSRLKNVFRARRLHRDLEDELSFHLEMRTRELISQGVDPVEAARQARLKFGSPGLQRERMRDAKVVRWLDDAMQDLRYGLRGMRRDVVVTAVVVVSLALALGANTAVFSIVDAVIFRLLPVSDPHSLVYLAYPIQEQLTTMAGFDEGDTFSYPLFKELRAAGRGRIDLVGMSYIRREDASFGGGDSLPEKIDLANIAGDGFSILGVTAAAGRLFTADDDVPGGHRVAILSHEFWSRRFGRDPAALGSTMRLEGRAFQIVGVTRRGFFGSDVGRMADVWIPLATYRREALSDSGSGWMHILGRLRRGVPRAQALAPLQAAFTAHREERLREHPNVPADERRRWISTPLRLHGAANGPSRFRHNFAKPLWVVAAVVAAAWLIACANAASLLLARGWARAREMAMRVSLGAGRGRLVRQLLTESLLLAATAAAAGFALARISGPALLGLLSRSDQPVRLDLEIDWRLFSFSAAATVVTALLFGLLPALRASQASPNDLLRRSAGDGGRLRLGRVFVAAQVAFSFVLVAGAAVFALSLRNLNTLDAGFDRRDLVLATVGAPNLPNQANAWETLRDQFRRIRELPGVQSAAATSWPIFSGSFWTSGVLIPGKPFDGSESIFYRVSPGYFETMRIALLAGRDFTRFDSEKKGAANVCIVNEAFAARYFGGGNPVGLRFQQPEDAGFAWWQIVGLVRSTQYSSLQQPAPPMVYVPLGARDQLALAIRTKLDPGSVAGMLRRELRAIHPALQLRDVTTQAVLVNNSIVRERLLAHLAGAFGFLGLVLAAIGLYGVLNYSVVRRTKEIGIRIALGGQPAQLTAAVVRDVLLLVASGLAVGMPVFVVLARFVKNLLFGLEPTDATPIAAALAVFLAVALAAGWIPARRAARVDPLAALRHE